MGGAIGTTLLVQPLQAEVLTVKRILWDELPNLALLPQLRILKLHNIGGCSIDTDMLEGPFDPVLLPALVDLELVFPVEEAWELSRLQGVQRSNTRRWLEAIRAPKLENLVLACCHVETEERPSRTYGDEHAFCEPLPLDGVLALLRHNPHLYDLVQDHMVVCITDQLQDGQDLRSRPGITVYARKGLAATSQQLLDAANNFPHILNHPLWLHAPSQEVIMAAVTAAAPTIHHLIWSYLVSTWQAAPFTSASDTWQDVVAACPNLASMKVEFQQGTALTRVCWAAGALSTNVLEVPAVPDHLVYSGTWDTDSDGDGEEEEEVDAEEEVDVDDFHAPFYFYVK